MKKLAVILSLVIACYLDSILFQRLNIYGVRPDALMAVVCSLGVLMGSLQAGTIGLAAGLFMDICFNKMIGLGAACYMAVGIAAGLFYHKFYADNCIIPAVTAAVASLLKELLMAIALVLYGVKYNFALMLVQYILPAALMTGVLCALVHLLLKPALTRQVKQGFDKNIGSSK